MKKDQTNQSEKRVCAILGQATSGKDLTIYTDVDTAVYHTLREMGIKVLDGELIKKIISPFVASAKMHAAKLFDVEKSDHDHARNAKCERAKAKREKLSEEREAAKRETKERKEGLAEYGEPTPEPIPPIVDVVIGTAVIAATLAISIHDVFFVGRLRGAAAWLASAIVGVACGGMVSWGLVATYEANAYNKKAQKIALAAGIIFSIALFLIRLVAGSSFTALMLSVGLSAVELAIVLWLNVTGRGLENQYLAFREDNEEYMRRVNFLAAAQQNLEKIEVELAEEEQVIHEHEQHLFEREDAAAQAETLTEAVEKVAEAAAIAAIMENANQMRGRKRSRSRSEG
ncbi:MAG: hypothetical protein WC457_02340 [Patescibacteria group bacterium]